MEEETTESTITELYPRFLKKLLMRADSLVWRATVEATSSGIAIDDLDAVTGDEWADFYQWEFEYLPSIEEICGALGLDPVPKSKAASPWWDHLLPGYRDKMRVCSGRALWRGDAGYEQEFAFRDTTGEIRWLYETVEIQPSGPGKWELICLSRDITRRKRAERSLVQSEAKFRSVWEDSHDPMRLTDRDGVIVAVNSSFCALVGQRESELVGRPWTVVLHPDEDHEAALATSLGFFRAFPRQKRFEEHWRLQDGQILHLEISQSLIKGNDGDRLCLAIARDSTERIQAAEAVRRSEAFFRSIWENSHEGMRLTDWEGRIVAVNDAFCRMVGLPAEEVVGRSMTEAYTMDIPPEEVIRRYRKRCQREELGKPFQASVTLRSGEPRHFEVSISQIEEEAATFLTIFRDVTEARQADERRSKLERKMVDAQRLESLGILAGGIAHDFNNLLTAILGNANIALMQMPPSSTLRPFLEGIEKTSLQAADLCKQMLAYSGQGRMAFRCISINHLVEEMNHLLEVSVHKQIILRYRLAASLPNVQAEPSELQQVVMNLVINASEAIGERSGVITISTGLVRADRAFLEETFLAPELPEGDYVSLEVADSGCGMTPETRERIFDPFFTTKFTGRGLGLAAVLGILQRHKGTFKVYSEVNHGTTFKILLPAVDREVEAAEQVAHAPGWRATGSILVVDDEPSVRAVAARMLEKCGLTVLLATHGGEAVEIFRRHKDELDLVLLDMTMPVMGGEEAFRQIRRIRPDAKVLLMSGYTEADTTDRFAGKGLAGFIQKPFKWEQLEAKLRTILPGEQTP